MLSFDMYACSSLLRRLRTTLNANIRASRGIPICLVVTHGRTMRRETPFTLGSENAVTLKGTSHSSTALGRGVGS